MANINDINKKISEITNALHDLSDEQYKSVERSVFGYLDVRELLHKKDEAETKFYTTQDKTRFLLKSEEAKVFNNRVSLLTSFDTFFINGKKKLLSSSKALDKLRRTEKADLLKTNTQIKKDISKDNTNAFLREKKDGNEEQIELLKSINEKIGNLTSPKSGGLFDFVLNALPKILEIAGMAEGGAAIGAGAIGAGLLGKYSKFIPKLGKIGKSAGRIASKAKSPTGIVIGLGAGVLGAIGLESVEGSNNSNNIEQRYSGGSVKKGKPYVVGELGAEIFVPNSNGRIVPNSKIQGQLTTDTLQKFSKEQTEKTDTALSKTIGTFSKPFDKNLKGYTKSINDNSNSFEEKLQRGFQYIKDGAFSMINSSVQKIDNMIPDIVKNTDAYQNAKTNLNIVPQTTAQVSPSTSQQSNIQIPQSPSTSNVPQNYHGAFEVPETGIRKIHNGEMVVPAYQSELIRAASELRNDYSIKKPMTYTKSSVKLDEKFWMEKFVPAFAKAIKIDKKKDFSSRIIESSVNPFG